MNGPAATHFTISPEEWMKLPKAKLWRDWGNAGDLHNLLDEYAVELSERVADVRPTRDSLAREIRETIEEWHTGYDAQEQVTFPLEDVIAEAIIASRFVAVSDSQETPE